MLKDLHEELGKRDFGFVRQLIASTLLSFLTKSKLYRPFSWQKGGEAIGRHPILHGHAVDFGTKVNADRLFMVLDSLFWLIGSSGAAE